MIFVLGFLAVAALRLGNILIIRGKMQRITAAVTVAASVGLCAGYFAASPTVFSAGLMIINLFLVINDLRLIEQRMHPEYLLASARRTWLWLYGCMITALLGWHMWSFFHMTAHTFLNIYDVLVFVAAAAVSALVVVNLRKSRLQVPGQHYSDAELPTLTVAIPARNETDALRNCLTKLLQNDYPKLEILVLDDCSQDETAQIIKSFAHDGVRFIEGSPAPDEHWLPKNWAYEQLLQQASGEFVVFMGVDVDVHPASLRNLITFMLASNKKMISLMPRRIETSLSSAFVQPMRYWLELIMPARLLRRPMVLSTVWTIRRQDLLDNGGFKSVSRSVIPERFFARKLAGGYAFYLTNPEIGIQTTKPLADQIGTAIRTRYPLVMRRPENVMLASVAMLALWVGPFIRLIAGGRSLLPILSVLLLVAAHFTITIQTNKKVWWLCLFNFPIVVLLETALLYVSMYKYEFSEVNWKDRNICLPVMHASSHLPRLPDEVPTVSS